MTNHEPTEAAVQLAAEMGLRIDCEDKRVWALVGKQGDVYATASAELFHGVLTIFADGYARGFMMAGDVACRVIDKGLRNA